MIASPINTDLLPAKIAHLEMLQNVISRMAGYSASCKNFCITILAAFLALYADGHDADYLKAAIPPLITFMLIDAKYLALEHGFRNQFDRVRQQPLELIDFAIISSGDSLFISKLFSWSVLLFYIPLLVLIFTLLAIN